MAATPPNQPTYGVHFTSAKINEIIAHVFPDRMVESIEPLPSHQSFNNRIYFLELTSSAGLEVNDAVLKVSGLFYGALKIQNEVASLFLLEKNCPAIPAPRVLAWSANGSESVYIVERSSEGAIKFKISAHPLSDDDDDSSDHGWMLLSKRPGRVLDGSDLRGEAGTKIMRQLAGFVCQMRQKIQHDTFVGNLTLEPDLADPRIVDVLGEIYLGLKIKVEGLLNCKDIPVTIVASDLEYYETRLRDQLIRLDTEKVLASNRLEISPLVERFLVSGLSELHLFKQQTPPVFTHYDLSPRNVLLSESGSITGLLDFEFAGFFPQEEEFANIEVSNEGDWPADAYATFLNELEFLGVKTPLKGFSEICWTEAKLLMKLIENIAPWFLGGDSHMEDAELRQECQKAAENVRSCIEEFSKLSEGT